MLRAALSSLALLALVAPAFAEPARYTLDPTHTQVGWSIDRFGFTKMTGRFDEASGVVMLDPENPANSSVTAEINVGSVDSGYDERDEHLRAERWLNAAAHPTMRFQSSSVTLTGENTATVVGDLSFRGVTQPVTLNVTLNKLGPSPMGGAPTAGFTATGVLSRSAFGLTIAPGAIGDEVAIHIEALAVGEAPAQN
ncbi:MAG: YceI family protein [Hydrogenophilaceae bacterium]|jgi:polyisoprenoid-binding protein YceI|nr:YceI family protein [Hydrogenophilaceae bacterium]